MELRKPKNCPKCGSAKFVGILYGRPTTEAREARDRGEIILGGCIIMPDQPDWECTACGHQWFDVDDPARIRRNKILKGLINNDFEQILNDFDARSKTPKDCIAHLESFSFGYRQSRTAVYKYRVKHGLIGK